MSGKRLTTILLALTLGWGPAYSAWDDPPLVNTALSTTGVVGLNFGMPGTRQQIAMFLISSNDPAGFHVVFNFANKGTFKSGSRTFSMSNVCVTGISGTLGTGLVPPNQYALTIDAGTGNATWTPTGGLPTGATDTYLIGIFADWADQSGMIAGFYQENITATVVSGF